MTAPSQPFEISKKTIVCYACGWVNEFRRPGSKSRRRQHTALPKGFNEPFFQRDGVWIVSPHLIRPVAEALRTLLLETHRVALTNTGREEKMELLYTYLTSENFSRKIRTVVDSFVAMKPQLDTEKRAIQKQWAAREMHINRVTETMSSFVGELQVIAQNALPLLNNIEHLELPHQES